MTAESELKYPDMAEQPLVIRISDRLGRFISWWGKMGSWFILPVVFVTVFDVTARKLIWIQIFLVENVSRYFGSTLLQEMEWHFHTALFALVLGYGYIINSHVRVDLIREALPFRKQAWIEFLGASFFMIPYCLVVTAFAVKFAYESFILNEISASLVGLSHRWIIKTVLMVGLALSVLAGVAVWLQSAMILFSTRKNLRFKLFSLEWPEDEGLRRLETEKEGKKLEEKQAAMGN